MRKLYPWKTRHKTFYLGGILAALTLAVVSVRWDSTAHGEVRDATPRQAFQSSGARSEIVLREIAATLKRIDARLERIEKAALQAGHDK